MNAEEFVKQITELKPKEEELGKTIDPDDLLNVWLSEFDIIQTDNQNYNNPIVALICNHDIRWLNINDIIFDPKFEEDETNFFFGLDITGNRLAINKLTGKVLAYEDYSDRITFQCAESSEKFLDALVELMKFVREKILNSYNEHQNAKRSIEVAYIASLKAGGEAYEDYYKTVLLAE